MLRNKKKILYVITKSNFGGAQRYVFELATHLSPNEYEVHVACGGSGVLVHKLHDAGIVVHSIKNFERDLDFLKEFRAFSELYRLITLLTPDIVHVNSSKGGGIGALAARLAHVRMIIFTAHGWPFFENRLFFTRFCIWFFSYCTVLMAHRTIVVSPYDMHHARMPFTKKKLVYISTAVPAITFKERSVARAALFDAGTIKQHIDDIWAVATSEHTKNKNLSALIRALGIYNSTASIKIFLTLIGEGEETEMLKALTAEIHANSHIHFTGYVDEARSYLHAFDLFILPSIKEGLPYGLLEAGSAGLFPIVGDVGGIPEVVTHDVHGLMIHPHKVHTLVDALHTYVTNNVQSEYMRKAFHEHVRKNFALDNMLRQTYAEY